MSELRVLFVDDEAELVSAVVERLRLRGVDARGAGSGAEALAEVAARPYDVIVLDVRMPSMSGLSVLRALEREHPGLAVILLSGHGSSEAAEEGLRLGAYDYLQKPVDIETLLETTRRAAAAKAARDELAGGRP